jgi:hypothetical protein
MAYTHLGYETTRNDYDFLSVNCLLRSFMTVQYPSRAYGGQPMLRISLG